jgi:fibronectin type 3 domain-containing protein
LRTKSCILAVSLIAICLALISCGKKGNPSPKSGPVPGGINDLHGEVKDGVLFLSFSIPTTNRDGSKVVDLDGFRLVKSCGGCGGGFAPWKEIHLTDKRGYTIRDGRFFTYDNDLQDGFEYGYRVYPVTGKGFQADGSNTFSIKWQRPPAAPKDVKVQEEDSRVMLTWAGENGLSYNVYRQDNDVYPLFPVNPAPVAAAHYTDMNLQNGKQYRYEVRAVRTVGNIRYEGEGAAVTATPQDKTPPAAPRDLKLEKEGGAVLLSWTPNTESDVAGYNVYRLTSGKPEKINSSIVPQSAFTDTEPGTDRFVSYQVTAVDRSGNESMPSREQIIILKD